MARKKLPYIEGDWFAVPLRTGEYGLGRAVRIDGRGGVLGYFFGMAQEQVPSKEAVAILTPAEAVLIRHCGDLGIIEGKWPIIGHDIPWCREDWPVPAFARIDEYEGKAWKVEYSDTDGTSVIREISISLEEAHDLPEDGLSGYGALEIRLTKLLTALPPLLTRSDNQVLTAPKKRVG